MREVALKESVVVFGDVAVVELLKRRFLTMIVLALVPCHWVRHWVGAVVVHEAGEYDFHTKQLSLQYHLHSYSYRVVHLVAMCLQVQLLLPVSMVDVD